MKCIYCQSDNKVGAHFCSNCGASFKKKKSNVDHDGIAAVLSFFFPGLGHLYKKRFGTAIGWFVGSIIGYMFFLIPGVVIHFLAILSAYQTPSFGD